MADMADSNFRDSHWKTSVLQETGWGIKSGKQVKNIWLKIFELHFWHEGCYFLKKIGNEHKYMIFDKLMTLSVPSHLIWQLKTYLSMAFLCVERKNQPGRRSRSTKSKTQETCCRKSLHITETKGTKDLTERGKARGLRTYSHAALSFARERPNRCQD